MGTSLYKVIKGNIMEFDVGRRFMGCFALPKIAALAASDSLSQITFPSWDNLYPSSLGILEKLDRCWEAYDWIILAEESM